MIRRSGIPFFISFTSALILLVVNANGQAVYGGIQGTITSEAGAPVRGAKIVVISEEKGAKVATVTNQSGHFHVGHLIPDTYDLRVEAGSYKPYRASDISVIADGDQEVDIRFRKATASDKVASNSGSSVLRTRPDVSSAVDRTQLQYLPNFDRNFTFFELLAPGTINLGPVPFRFPDPLPNKDLEGGLHINVNGQHFSGTAFQLDGTDDRDPVLGVILVNPPVDSITEVKIDTQNFDAELGQALAGVITAQTKSGSNSWHGSAFGVRRTDFGQASPPALTTFLNHVVPVPPFNYGQYGASVGGPIARNKLFIFGYYQGTRRAFEATQWRPVPTDLVRTTCLNPNSAVCDLSQYPGIIPGLTPSIASADAQGGSTAIGLCKSNCIPTAKLSPQAIRLLSLLPPPNFGGPNDTIDNFMVSGSEISNDHAFGSRLDYNATDRLKMFGRYSFGDFAVNAGAMFGDLIGGFGVTSDGFSGNGRTRAQNIAAGFDYSLRPSIVTDFRFGYFRYHISELQGGLGTLPATAAGIPNLNLGNAFTSGMPGIDIEEPRPLPTKIITAIRFGYGTPINFCNCPLLEQEQQFQGASNWSNTRGNHLLKWGADIHYEQNRLLRSDQHPAGDLTFSSSDTRKSGITAKNIGLASFLLGDVTSFDRSVIANNRAGENQKRWFFYGQDTWRIKPGFTLNYGLRWEIYFPQSVTGKGAGGFLDLKTGLINVAGYPGINLHGNVRNSYRNFGPRLGLAYQLSKDTVLRAGYGRSFDVGFAGSTFAETITENPPVIVSQILPERGQNIAFNLSQGPPAPPAVLLPNVPASGQFRLPDGVPANVVLDHMRMPTVDAWNLMIQHAISQNMSVEVGYVGNKGTHVFTVNRGGNDINEATLDGYAKFNCNKTPNSTDCLSRHPFFNRFGWTQQILCFCDNSSDNYHSLQAKFDKHFKKDYQVVAHYTWSKSMVFLHDYFDVNPRLNYAPNIFDRTHVFVLANIADLPFGKGKPLLGNVNGTVNRIIGGWTVSSFTRIESGLPFSPSYDPDECKKDRDAELLPTCRPNVVGKVVVTGDRNNYFTTTNGLPLAMNLDTIGPWQRPAIGTFGTASRHLLRAPGFSQTDLAVSKSIAITEGYAVQFRTELLNAFNEVNLGYPIDCVDCKGGGVINKLADGAAQRQVEFALRLQF